MSATRILDALPPAHREELLKLAREVVFPVGTRLFEEGENAERFWIIRSGTVSLDLSVPGLRAPVFETVGEGELLGWSWMVPPHRWRFGAQTAGEVTALEFDAAAVRDLCDREPEVGVTILKAVTEALAHRLTAARTRVLSVYGAGPVSARHAAVRTRPAPVRRQPGPFCVGDVMTQQVVAVNQSAPFKVITQTLERWRVSALPVIEQNGRVVGLVSEADLLRKEEFHNRPPSLLDEFHHRENIGKARSVTARQLMTSPAVTVHADAPVAEAARLMARHGVKRLPVVDGIGRLTGIVSRSDLLQVFARDDDELAEDIRGELTALPFLDGDDLEIRVADGVVTLRGTIGDTSRIGLVVRLTRSVEGVVDVLCELTGRRTGQRPEAERAGESG
ncbi:hypothetical protein GCM10009716_23070 [Streptomyces sodiiphilus]|uniref:CBS domain-containing protein n=1 Tax=Streptomyces sodiiphilus TaxID=226217 RepID=A0ABN2P5K0_9ACTN